MKAGMKCSLICKCEKTVMNREMPRALSRKGDPGLSREVQTSVDVKPYTIK